jgi:hypothetical protein
MMRLNQDQFDVFKDFARANFYKKTACNLRERLPVEARAFDDLQLEEVVATAGDRGQAYGVTSAYDIRRFAECLLVHGMTFPDGETHGWARDVLEKGKMTGRAKMNMLIQLECLQGRPAP